MIEIDVKAALRWNDTGLDVMQGDTVAVEAFGEWKDSTILCGPRGFTKRLLAPVNFTKRHSGARWFELTAVIAKFDGPYYRVGDSATFECHKAGRLYLFANDAWYFYYNNSGSISARITVEK